MQIIHFRLMICCEVIRRQSIDGQVVELRMTRSRIKIVRRALEEPLRQIAANAGKEGAVVVENVAAKKTAAYGYNVATEELPSGNHVLQQRGCRWGAVAPWPSATCFAVRKPA